MRSEVAACPYFRQRMALLLEAYLLGSGQAMLDGFSLQVQAAQALQQVALQVKEMFPDKTDLPPTGRPALARVELWTRPRMLSSVLLILFIRSVFSCFAGPGAPGEERPAQGVPGAL